MARLGSLFALVAMALAAPARADNGSEDLASRYLESARHKLQETTELVRAGVDLDSLCTCADETSTDALCLSLRALDDAQRAFCRDVITATAGTVQALNSRPHRVPLAVSADPLYVTDPYGHEMEVTAGTDLGPGGGIVTSEDRIRTLGPMDLLALLGHEFHHKAAFPTPGRYITDNAPIGPFTQPGGGRTLLDAVGAGLAWYAYQHHLIGRTLHTSDSYTCEVKEETTGMDFSTLGESARVAMATGDQGDYETGVGNWPTDLQCSLRSDTTHQLLFRVKIHEGKAERWTRVELWQIEAPRTNGGESRQHVLERRVVKGWTPVGSTEPPRPLALDFKEPGEAGKRYSFRVQWVGSAELLP